MDLLSQRKAINGIAKDVAMQIIILQHNAQNVGGINNMPSVKVHEYAVYKDGIWTGDVYHFITIFDKVRIERERKVKLISMASHLKRMIY